ncbi:MAG: AMIN domain-containing protein, partial [Candidatus Dadabacteria bacterium]|nr:AMIN domain-containing protein [Candidatus Dadabacteria bacterium]
MCPGSRRPIRGCLIVAAALLIHSGSICAASPAAAPRQVRRIRSWTAPDHTRVVLDMSSRSAYTSRVLDNPHRIVIDIPSCSLASGVSAMDVN